MAYDIRVGSLFTVGVDSEEYVLKVLRKYSALLLEGKTAMSWEGEGDGASLEFTLAPDLVRSECILFLKKINPTKYGGYTVNCARQIRF